MDYIKKVIDNVRKDWFKNHKVKRVDGETGFQRIVWGEEGTRMYQVEYVLSDNMVFVSGDLGDAVYELTCPATIENIADFDLSYFTGKLTTSSRDRWDFDYKKAQKEIEEYFLDICEVDSIAQLPEADKGLYDELTAATLEWSDADNFEMLGVWPVYNNTDIDWFDSEMASAIGESGRRLSPSIISYWVGLQMVAEGMRLREEAPAS